ncbi:hypothetical protein [Micromonospora sp. DT47]|uniref:hypothetical protein n=1 Tax=Micromonospora sp. DT47 TaxID=3393431 RepID=UPI003CE9B563
MAGKRRFRGPGGGIFVPHRTVSEVTIKTLVEAGEWTPVEDEPKKAVPAKKAARPAAKSE